MTMDNASRDSGLDMANDILVDPGGIMQRAKKQFIQMQCVTTRMESLGLDWMGIAS